MRAFHIRRGNGIPDRHRNSAMRAHERLHEATSRYFSRIAITASSAKTHACTLFGGIVPRASRIALSSIRDASETVSPGSLFSSTLPEDRVSLHPEAETETRMILSSSIRPSMIISSPQAGLRTVSLKFILSLLRFLAPLWQVFSSSKSHIKIAEPAFERLFPGDPHIPNIGMRRTLSNFS